MIKLLLEYLLNVAIWIDEGLNTLRGGSPNETVSAASAKAQQQGKLWGCILCRLLNVIQKDHCAKSLEPKNRSLWGD